MKNKVMQIVEKICNMKSTDCRNLNKGDLARELLNLANVPQNAGIQEIPLDWDNQVVILFVIPGDKENYYSLFAGIGNDNNFYFELSITGKNPFTDKFYFLDEDELLPIDYFLEENNVKEISVNREYNPEVKTMYYHIEPVAAHKLTATTEESNKAILTDFYAAVEWLLSRGYDEYHEEYSNTINPTQQNIFTALRSYRVMRNGHYKSVKIFQRAFGGCVISECNLQNEWSK